MTRMKNKRTYKSLATIALVVLYQSLCSVLHAAAPFQTDTLFAHDPVMAQENGIFYLFSTGMNLQKATSTDRKTWTVYPEGALQRLPQWTHDSVPGFKDHTWAPDIIRWHGKWWLTYSCSTFGKNTSAIGLAYTDSLATGQWVDGGCVVASHETDNYNAIDPNVVIDDNDTPWLTFGSFWDGIQLVRLDSTLHIASGERPRTIARRYYGARPQLTNPTSKFAGANAIEAPFIMKHDGWYYLFVSWDYCCMGEKSTYKVVVGRSPNVEGPYFDQQGKDMAKGGGTLVIEGDKTQFEAAGHCSAYTFNGHDYFFCHGYAKGKNGMALLVQKDIVWDEFGWPQLH